MTFTDDDLKWLKKELKGRWLEANLRTFNLKALLARLEAAEHFAEIMEGGTEINECDSCFGDEDDDGKRVHEKDCEIKLALEAWRKAAGK